MQQDAQNCDYREPGKGVSFHHDVGEDSTLYRESVSTASTIQTTQHIIALACCTSKSPRTEREIPETSRYVYRITCRN